jgi:hypothetical protein
VDSAPRGNYARLLALALWLGALTVLGYHLLVEVTTIGLPEPMGLWETTYASLARVFPHEYQPGNFVLGHDNYGPGYPAFCRPFLALVADPYAAHRVANLVALALAAAVLAWLLRQNRAPAAVAAGVVALFFALNAGSYSLQARPDFLVLFLIAAVFAVGHGALRGRLSPGATGVLLGAAALAAYLTKPYSLFAWGSVLLALALSGHLRSALVAGVVSASILAGGIGAYARANPYYLLETFHAHVAHTSPDFAWLVHQSGDFLLLTGGVVLAGAAGCAHRLRRGRPAAGTPPSPDPDLRYWATITALAVLALGGGLGWHTGAYLTYYFHLLLLPLCVWAVVAGGAATGILVLANLAVLMVLAPAIPVPDPGWAEISRDVLGQPGPVVVDSLLAPLAQRRSDARVADTGIERYALDEPGLIGAGVAGQPGAAAEVRAFTAAQTELLVREPPAALYLDFVSEQNPHGPPGERVFSTRNALPWFSVAYLSGLTPVHYFHLRPYYGATNERRQDAGTWETLIIKFVPKRKPPAASP